MLKIGIDKTDMSYRHFEYDDERKYGNPQVYKVLYEETGEFSEVLCSNVISIKKSNSIKNHFLDIPIYSDNKTEDIFKEYKTLNVSYDTQIKSSVTSEENEENKKIKSTKLKTKKDKQTSEKEKKQDVKDVPLQLDIKSIVPKSYEYDVLVIDDISDVKSIKDVLNEMGHNGWEVCGFQSVNKIFGCQAIFIMKKGLY